MAVGPCTVVGAGQDIGQLHLQRWAGVQIPIHAANDPDLVFVPLRSLSADTVVTAVAGGSYLTDQSNPPASAMHAARADRNSPLPQASPSLSGSGQILNPPAPIRTIVQRPDGPSHTHHRAKITVRHPQTAVVASDDLCPQHASRVVVSTLGQTRHLECRSGLDGRDRFAGRRITGEGRRRFDLQCGNRRLAECASVVDELRRTGVGSALHSDETNDSEQCHSACGCDDPGTNVCGPCDQSKSGPQNNRDRHERKQSRRPSKGRTGNDDNVDQAAAAITVPLSDSGAQSNLSHPLELITAALPTGPSSSKIV